MTRDTLYNQPRDVGAFRFDAHVAKVFSDMIQRSVPGYDLTLEMIAVIARRFGRAGYHCYDLGCSLGASTLALRHGLVVPDTLIIAVDNSKPMVDRCRNNITRDRSSIPVDIINSDILRLDFEPCALAVMNFTLQFIPEPERIPLLARIATAMPAGAALVLSEKIRLADGEDQAVLTELHHEFKRFRGYSDLEIAQKRTALEQVLVPDTVDTHRQRLLAAGFSQVALWFQCFTFVSLLAIK